ncbi:MAG: hypothetical protein HKN23_12060, partial [Verrucomicrobiales bacterium]|nr:hypothetical protein [Verrucomicrobiales bacterium]
MENYRLPNGEVLPVEEIRSKARAGLLDLDEQVQPEDGGEAISIKSLVSTPPPVPETAPPPLPASVTGSAAAQGPVHPPHQPAQAGAGGATGQKKKGSLKWLWITLVSVFGLLVAAVFGV